jgi:hypothetical protein
VNDVGRIDIPRLLSSLGMSDAVRKGNKWHHLCPAHSERKASWAILDEEGNKKHGRHRCMSCGFHGDPVELVRHVFGLATRTVAAEWVEARAIRPEVSELRSLRHEYGPRGRQAFRLPPGVLFGPSVGWHAPARRYLEERGIAGWQVDRWGIGYAIDGRLAGRIVFPSADESGAIRSYTARSYVGSPVRYLTPRKIEGAHPGMVWGERWWPPEGGRGLLYLTEGAINGLAVERAFGLWTPSGANPRPRGVGAIGGSSSTLSIEQTVKIASWGRIVLVADPDLAGEKLVETVANGLGRAAVKLSIARPEGGDAAAVGSAALAEALRAAG